MVNSWHVILGYLPWFELLLANYPVFLLTFIPVLNYGYTSHSLTCEISLPEVRPLGTFSCQPNLSDLHPSIFLCLHQLGCTDVEARITRFKAWFVWLIDVCVCKLHSSRPVVWLAPILSRNAFDALCGGAWYHFRILQMFSYIESTVYMAYFRLLRLCYLI